MKRIFSAVAALVAMTMLSGCVGAAIVANLAAAGGISALADRGMKNAAGAQVEFTGTLRPMPGGKKVAVVPRDQVQVALAEKLRSINFDVVSPTVVAALFAQAGMSSGIDSASELQLIATFKFVCAKTVVDLVVAGRPDGSGKGDVYGYSCANSSLWTDKLDLGRAGPEAIGVIADRWASRIADAQALGAQASAQ